MEERDSAHSNRYEWNEWRNLSYDTRVDAVAYSRLTRIIGMVQEDAVSTEMSRRQKRSSRKS